MARALINKEATGRRRTERRRGTAGNRWLDGFIPYRLYRVTKKLGARLQNRLRTLHISPSQWRVLSVLKAFGDLSIGEIVDATLMEQPTISRVVARLERDGRVKRRLSVRDSRMVLISLTTAGVEAFNKIIPAALRHQDEALHGIGRREIALLVATLEKIERNVEAHD